MSYTINEVGRITHLKNKIPSIGKINDFSKEDHDKFLKKNSFYCRRLDLRLSRNSCRSLQKRAVSSDNIDPTKKCFKCKWMDPNQIKTRPGKVCKLHDEFPGLCEGDGYFKQAYNQSCSHFHNKIFCSQTCAVRYNNCKNKGWKSNDDVTGKMKNKIDEVV